MNILEKVLKLSFWFITILFIPLCSLFFYTPEYETVKDILNHKISFSVLLLLFCAVGAILVILQVVLYILRLKNKIKNNELDKDVMKLIKELFPMQYAKYFFEFFDFGSGKFPYDHIERIQKFIDIENNPEYEFIDQDLEARKLKLLKEIKKLKNLLVEYASSVPGEGDMWRVDKELKYRNPVRYQEVINDINELATNIWREYEFFVKIGRKKLGV